jgi:hypothetical protein
MKVKFYDNKDIKLVKDWKCLQVFKKGVVGPTEVVDNFFKHENSTVRITKLEKCREWKRPKLMLLVLEGWEVNPDGIGFKLWIDKDTGKFPKIRPPMKRGGD